MIAHGSTKLNCQRRPYVLELDNGVRISAKAIVIATGANYRRLTLDNISKFEGAGVYYSATFVESQLCRDEEVIVVGGGNSAGQAAVFLAQTAKRVHIFVRAPGLAESMSRYLIARIEQNPVITLHTHTQIVGLEGNNHLERVQWSNKESGASDN